MIDPDNKEHMDVLVRTTTEVCESIEDKAVWQIAGIAERLHNSVEFGSDESVEFIAGQMQAFAYIAYICAERTLWREQVAAHDSDWETIAAEPD